MNKKFTKLIAALALLVFMTPSLVGWGQTPTTAASFSRSGNTNNVTGGTFSAQAEQKSGYYQDGSGTKRYIQILNNSAYWSSTPTSITLDAKIGGGTGNTDLANDVYAVFLDNNGAEITSSLKSITNHITTNTGDNYEVAMPLTNAVYGIRIYHVKESGYNVRYYSFSLSYVAGSGPATYTVTFNAGEGTFVGSTDFPNASNTVAAGTYTLPSATPATGYTFDGWLATGSSNPVTGSYEVSGDVAFTAAYSENTGGGSGNIVTLTATNLSLPTGNSYNDNETEVEYDNITYAYNKLKSDSDGNIQAQATYGNIRNITAYPGDITSVVITHTGMARVTNILGSANGTDWTQVATGSGSITANFSGLGYKYFQITRDSNAAYWSKIEITYSISTDPTITFDPASISLGNVAVDQQIQQTFTVAQANLAAGISLSASVGTLSTNSIAQGAAVTQVTWTYTPTASGAINATITATSETLQETLAITGTAKTAHNIAFNIVGQDHGCNVTASPNPAVEGQTITLTPTAGTGWYLESIDAIGQTSGDTPTGGVTNNGDGTYSFTMPDEVVTVGATFAEKTATFTDGIYTETLRNQASFNNMTAVNVTGEKEWYFENGYGGYATIDGSSTGEHDWLITPKMPVYNGKLSISFTIWHSQTGNLMSLKWSTSNDVVNGTWNTLQFEEGTDSHDVENIEITTTEPYIYVAFEYQGVSTGQYSIRDFTAKQYYTITAGNPTGGSIMTDPEDLAVVGSQVEVIADAGQDYHFVSWDITPSTVTIENGEFTMPATNVTVSATFEQNVYYTVTYSENGVEIGESKVGGTTITLPTTPAGGNPANLTFVGWSASQIDTYTETAPTLVTTHQVSADVTFYAVYKYDYSYTEGGGTPTWTKVTDASTLSVGDQLVIAYEDDENGKVAGGITNKLLTTKTASFSNGIITALSDDAVVFTLGGASGVWTLNNGDNVLAATAAKELVWYSNKGTTTWTIEINASNNAIISSTTTSYGSIQYNYNSGNDRFLNYTSSQTPIQLYRLENGSTTVSGTYYLTSVTVRNEDEIVSNETTWAGNNIINAEVIINNTGKLTVGGLLISTDADFFTIENNGQLKVANDGVKATVKKSITGYGSDNNVKTGWNFIALPITESFAPANPMTSNTYDLYRLNPATTIWENFKPATGSEPNAASGFSLVNGRGYLYANSGTVDLSFAGTIKPFTTEGNANQVALASGWNLVGNPYTFNVYSSKSYYTITTVDDVNVITAVTSASDYIAPCSGIVIENTGTGTDYVAFLETTAGEWSNGNKGNIEMTLAQQATNRGNAATLDNAIVSFNEGNQLGKFYFGTQNANLYIPQGAEEYAIVSTEAQGEMPVNFRANENGRYTLTVNPENVEMNYLHLIDNMTGADIDLLQTPSYTFNANVTDYESRFRLVFAANNNNEVGPSTGSGTFAFYSNGNWIINNAGEATLQVVDLTGRILSSETVNGSVSKTINATPGVYMLRLINGENVKVQKIVVR